jgi:hypothetical protein
LSVFENSEHVKGVTKVLDAWKKIYKNSKEYVCDILTESPQGMDEILISRIKNGVKYRHIVSKNLNEHEDRKNTLKKLGYFDLIEQGKIERKELKSTGTILILNEKEAGIIFPGEDGEPDLRHMFYGNESYFQDWCKDYFEHNWGKSNFLTTHLG